MYGELAQHYAVKVGHTHVAKLLILDGRFDFRELSDHGDTALHIAAKHGYKELMSCLLSLPYIDSYEYSSSDSYEYSSSDSYEYSSAYSYAEPRKVLLSSLNFFSKRCMFSFKHW
jgi:ankyrin repeat protein